jgi:purine-nucleoside phosphorylase
MIEAFAFCHPSCVEADAALLSIVEEALATTSDPVERGATWATDAPYGETLEAIATARANGILAVEMEAAALYAVAEARCKPELCFAYVTKQMGQSGDFEKGEANGAIASLALVRVVAKACLGTETRPVAFQLVPVGAAIEPGTSR